MPTDSLVAILVFSFFASLGAVVSPGPVMAAIVTEAPRQGWRVGPLVAVGHTLLELILLVLLGLSLSFGLATPLARRMIAITGGLVLIFIGLSYILGTWRGRITLPQADETSPERSWSSMILLGVVTTVSNPFWYTWWVTVAAGYLAQARQLSTLAVAIFYIGHISADFAWDTTLSVATSTGTRYLSARRYQILIVLTGLFMLYLGFVFLRSSWIS